MNSSLTTPTIDALDASVTSIPVYLRSRVSWPAIFAGVAAALSLELLFVLLGAGLGFSIYTPLTDENPIASFGTGAAVIEGISAVFSLWFGGWVAGRFTPTGSRLTGAIHGLIVWSAATLAGLLLVSTGAGWAMGDVSKIVGGGLSAAGKPVAAAVGGATDLAKDAAKKSGDTLSSFVEEAASNHVAGSTPGSTIRAKREIGAAVTRVFTNDQPISSNENRAQLVKALTENTNLTPVDADKLVTDWTASYNHLKSDLKVAKDEAAEKARVAADDYSDSLAIFSFAAFAALALGAIAATFGGEHGANCAIRRHHRPEVIV
ncbi:MAG: hypothetical protein ABI273_11725 [Lacunisphaera sp.]